MAKNGKYPRILAESLAGYYTALMKSYNPKYARSRVLYKCSLHGSALMALKEAAKVIIFLACAAAVLHTLPGTDNGAG